VRILSIDGGGIRGVIPAVVLAEVERRTGRRVSDLFDLIAGTSTGGILAAALSRPADGAAGPRYTAEELIDLYVSEGPRIFSRSLIKRITSAEGYLDERYDSSGLDAALRRYLGEERLSGVLTNVLVTAYDIEERRAFFFRSARARTDPAEDYTLVDAVRATAAAPTYFEPAQVAPAGGGPAHALIDGGVFAINPAMCAFADLARAGRADELTIVASLGTGSLVRPLPYARVRGWGRLEWAQPILDVVFDGVADTIDFQLDQLLPGGRYVRLQTRLEEASDDLDDASPGNLAALRREGDRLVRDRSADIDRLCAALVASGR